MSHLSTLVLHQYRLHELSDEATVAARGHLETCVSCSDRLHAAQADEDAMASEPLPAFLAGLQARPEVTELTWVLWLRKMAPSAVALAAAAAVLMLGLPSLQHSSEPGVRTRGALPSVEVWVEAPSGPRPLRVGEALGEGDRVQLFFDPKGAKVVGLAGRDQSGAIEFYRLLTPTKPGLQPAPFGLTLDGIGGTQEFFVVAGGANLDERAVTEAIRTGEGDVQRIVIPKDPKH